MAGSEEILLADADVLIDYRDSDFSILGVVSQRIAPVRVIRQVLQQVRGISARECAAVGIEILEVETATLLEAGRLTLAVGFEDALCFVVCRDRGWTCVTNDRALNTLCRTAGIKVTRGLRLLVDLVNAGQLPSTRASAVARAMHESNPAHIHAKILEEFEGELKRIGGR